MTSAYLSAFFSAPRENAALCIQALLLRERKRFFSFKAKLRTVWDGLGHFGTIWDKILCYNDTVKKEKALSAHPPALFLCLGLKKEAISMWFAIFRAQAACLFFSNGPTVWYPVSNQRRLIPFSFPHHLRQQTAFLKLVKQKCFHPLRKVSNEVEELSNGCQVICAIMVLSKKAKALAPIRQRFFFAQNQKGGGFHVMLHLPRASGRSPSFPGQAARPVFSFAPNNKKAR